VLGDWSAYRTTGDADIAVELALLEGPREASGEADITVRPDGVVTARRADFRLVADVDARQATVWLVPGAQGLASALRVILSRFLPNAMGSLLLHAGASIIDGRAWVYFGPSGVGKSTVAAQLERWPLLSDEMVAVALDEGSGVTAWGTPFSFRPERPSIPGGAPVGGLFELGCGASLSERRLPDREGTRSLLASTVLFGEPGDLAGVVMDVARDVSARVGVTRLVLPRDPAAAAFFEASAAGSR